MILANCLTFIAVGMSPASAPSHSQDSSASPAQRPAHVQLVGRFGYKEVCPRPGTDWPAGTTVWVPCTPTGSTQDVVVEVIELFPLKGRTPIPESEYVRHEVFYTSEDSRSYKQKLVAFWFPRKSAYLSQGVRSEVSIYFNLLRVGIPTTTGGDAANGFEGENSIANISDPGVRKFVQDLPYSDQDPQPWATDIAALRGVSKLLTYQRLMPRDISAAGVIRARSGDCGSASTLVMATYRSLGIPSRLEVGAIISNPSKSPKNLIGSRHMRVSALRMNYWIPIEATFEAPPEERLGTANPTSVSDMIIRSYGFNVRASFASQEGVQVKLAQQIFNRTHVTFTYLGAKTGKLVQDRLTENSWREKIDINEGTYPRYERIPITR